MEKSRLYLTICVIALCGVSSASYSSITTKFTFTGVSFIGKLALNELIFNFVPAEASPDPFFRRMGHYAKSSSEESDEDDDENVSQDHGRIAIAALQKPKPQNGDQCLAKLLCGMSVVASNKATKPDYYKDYAHLVSRYFQVFGSEDGSIESIEAYDDYSVEDDEAPPPPPPPPTSKVPEKFDISLGFTNFLSTVQNITDESDPTASPKAGRNRGAGKLSQRLARAAKIVEGLNRQGRRPQPSHCQSLTGCSYTFKELRAKLKSGTKGKFSTSSSSSGKAPLRYKVQPKPISTISSNLGSNDQQFGAFNPNKADDELDEIFGSDAFAPAKPKNKKNQQSSVPPPPPPPPIYIRRTIIKKKRPSSSSTGINDDEESASTTIIRVAPSPVQTQQNIPGPIQADIEAETEEKPKRKVAYKKPPKKTKVKDNGDDEDDDINQTLPVKIITSEEYNNEHHKIYNIDNGYQKEQSVTPIKDSSSTKVSPAKNKKKKDEESDEDEEEDDQDSEEDEENDDEDDDDSKKKKKTKEPEKKSKPSIVVEGDDDQEPKKKLSDDDEVAEAQKDFWGGLTFIKRQKEKDVITNPNIKRKYQVSKNKGHGQSSNSKDEEEKEESKEDDENSKESEENDEKEDDEKDSEKRDENDSEKKRKIPTAKLDIDIPPSAEHDLAFPSRLKKEKEKVSLKPKKRKNNKKKEKDDSSSEEENNASIVITEIGGRPLAPPKDPSVKRTPSVGAQPSPFKLQFISPYPSKQKSSSYSSPSAYGGGNINKPEKLMPAAAPLTSHAFLKSNLPNNAGNTNVQGKPDMFSRISSLSPISSFTSFFRKGSHSQQNNMPENNAPPASPFMKRPVGPESSKFRRAPNRDKRKKKF